MSLAQYLLVQHVLDPMHCEKNICENVMKTIWGQKDILKSRLNLQEANIRPNLHPIAGRTTGKHALAKGTICAHEGREERVCGDSAKFEDTQLGFWESMQIGHY